MNQETLLVLNAIYDLEADRLARNQFDNWITPAEILTRLNQPRQPVRTIAWLRSRLNELWIARKILQIPDQDSEPAQVVVAELSGLDRHLPNDGRLRLEADDARGADTSDFQEVALYSDETLIRIRSRVAEIGRMLARNYLRFGMAPATGVLRYERRPQRRPIRNLPVDEILRRWTEQLRAGFIRVETPEQSIDHSLRADAPREQLVRAAEVVLQALRERLGGGDSLAQFQVSSVSACLAGLYSDQYRRDHDAHVITAGVGSGKSFAFQIGALIHVAAMALLGLRGLRALFIYPRVALALNQFQDLEVIAIRTRELLGVAFEPPCMDAGSQLQARFGADGIEAGKLFNAIRRVYGTGNYPIVISNLDTLANRLAHPEAARGLVENLDLIVCDEVHLLSGLYGSNARMLLKRLLLARTIWRVRSGDPNLSFSQLLARRGHVSAPYFVGASATIASPQQHLGRLFSIPQARVLHIDVTESAEKGWVHHFFLRQRPEVSSISALVNATACLIHNRRDGLFREYYRQTSLEPLGLHQLGNPIQGTAPANVELPDPETVHKTVGFCDSLDSIGRWADLVADNEATKENGVVFPNPRSESYPYFTRFQEPLWRQVHQLSFAERPPRWIDAVRQSYGALCRNCKKGIRATIPRIPPTLNDAGRTALQALWSFSPNDYNDSYLGRLGVSIEQGMSTTFAPVRDTAQQENISNLDRCPFFRTGLCWWWSMDSTGCNAPRPPSEQTPINGIRMAGPRNDRRHHFVNGIRLNRFTSKSGVDLMSLASINDLFRGHTNQILRSVNYPARQDDNSVFLIGSPRLEVGVDLDRVGDGITFRAMRDPASLQQKVGRVGREVGTDSVLVHIVTQNTRDQYYFRNPNIALDPNFLQPLPLHEDNRIIARHHFFMAITDFLAFQGQEPGARRIANNGDRLVLVNDHSQAISFGGWDAKVGAVYDFLFGQHPHAAENLQNLSAYLRVLGAVDRDLQIPNHHELMTPATAPMSIPAGVLDIFRHDFGPNFFLTPITARGQTFTLASSITQAVPTQAAPTNLPRHRAFLQHLETQLHAGGGRPVQWRSYVWDLLAAPVFRRGVPSSNLPGNHPFVWTSNFFEAVGVENIRVVQVQSGQPREWGYESLSSALGLLMPGTVTYRYTSTPLKVPVGSVIANAKPNQLAHLLQRVALQTALTDYFEPAEGCPPIEDADLPPDFTGFGPVDVFTPRQIPLIQSDSEPRVLPREMGEGLLLDNDSRDVPVGNSFAMTFTLPQPPRSFPLQWFRIAGSDSRRPIETLFQNLLRRHSQNPPVFPWPPIFSIFSAMEFDPQLRITQYVWGMDRQFTSRRADAARLVYWREQSDGTPAPTALGYQFTAPGLVLTVDTRPGSAAYLLVDEILQNPSSVVYQSLIPQVLRRFIERHGRVVSPNTGFFGPARPSSFVVSNIQSIVLFHLLDRWFRPRSNGAPPSQPPVVTLSDLAGCFDPNHANWISAADYSALAFRIAEIHEPASIAGHQQTVSDTRPNFEAASGSMTRLNADFFREVAIDLLLNSLSIAAHSAGLRLSGAESENLDYFYRIQDSVATIHLFDTDAFGNGAAELIRDHFFIPNLHRALNTRLRMLGQQQDPLPTTDFARSFEEELQECASSQAAHLAFHDLAATGPCWTAFEPEVRGERLRAGPLFDFLRVRLGLASFDHLSLLRECPEYIAYASGELGAPLIGTPDFPAFQSLESALGFCLAGCVACVVAPETNLHGNLESKHSVNKTLLDAFYRRVVCEAGTNLANVTYPATGPSRTCACAESTLVQASALAKDATPLSLELIIPVGDSGEQVVSIVSPLVTRGGAPTVIRTSWALAPQPTPRVRVRMDF